MAEKLSGSDGLSRREFVATGVAAGAVLALPGVGAVDPAWAQAADGGAPASLGAINVNGKDMPLGDDPRATLLDALREQFGLTGSKKGCDHGQCGACTVLVDGKRVYACLMLAAQTVGSKVTTVEGLASGDALHPVQAAFIKHDAFQCGYCTPGQLCSAVGLMAEARAKTADEIRERMSGNLCRCGAYVNIVAAVQEAQGTA